MEGITSFFFNIIPGALLIFVLEKYTDFQIIIRIRDIDPKTESVFFWLIIFSIFLGFLFQAASKWVKEHYLYNLIWCKVTEEDSSNFNQAVKFLNSNKLLPATETGKIRIRRIFFTIDNYISLGGGGRLLTHFASRLAYWFNLLWVSLILMILLLFRIIEDTSIIPYAIAFLILTVYETWIHLFNHYDILLKTFVSVINIDTINKKNIIQTVVNSNKR